MTDIIGGSAVGAGTYRATEVDVRTILGVNSSTSVILFISTANSLVNKVALCAGDELSNAELALIETWLAAHFFSILSPSVTSKSNAGGSVSYQRGQLGNRLESTAYGQQALILDTSGCLAEITGEKMELTWLGID